MMNEFRQQKIFIDGFALKFFDGIADLFYNILNAGNSRVLQGGFSSGEKFSKLLTQEMNGIV
jgi:hypothetical protein